MASSPARIAIYTYVATHTEILVHMYRYIRIYTIYWEIFEVTLFLRICLQPRKFNYTNIFQLNYNIMQ